MAPAGDMGLGLYVCKRGSVGSRRTQFGSWQIGNYKHHVSLCDGAATWEQLTGTAAFRSGRDFRCGRRRARLFPSYIELLPAWTKSQVHAQSLTKVFKQNYRVLDFHRSPPESRSARMSRPRFPAETSPKPRSGRASSNPRARTFTIAVDRAGLDLVVPSYESASSSSSMSV